MSTSTTRRRLLTGVAGATAFGTMGALGAGSAAAHPGKGRGKGKGHGRDDKPLIGRATHDRIHVMTYNIRGDFDAAPGDPDRWEHRRPLLIDLLEIERPTLLGIQEAMFHQLDAVTDALGDDYELVGYGRDGGSRGEYSGIFVDSERFEVREWDQFWLSDTPNVIGSATWGNNVTRIAVWARLRDHRTDRELIMLNTHFDHESQNARVRSAEAIIATLSEVGQNLPVLVTGDFNATAGESAAYAALVDSSALRDTWTEADEQLTAAWGTFPDYEDPVEDGERIDWVLAGGGVRIHEAAINVWTRDGAYPSDHTPVQALVELD